VITKPKKSNVLRLLESRPIPYHAYTYATDIRSAGDVAHVLGIPAHEVYKTLVVLPPPGKPLLMISPGPWALDLRRLAQALGIKRLRLATHREAEELTGLQVGRIWAMALLDRGFQVYVEQAAQRLTAFVMSAGQRGMNIRLRVDDFMSLTQARFADAPIDRDAAL
jgi:Cys-tRNA(Pro)/Cys-tRNA(Cys) deacylase